MLLKDPKCADWAKIRSLALPTGTHFVCLFVLLCFGLDWFSVATWLCDVRSEITGSQLVVRVLY